MVVMEQDKLVSYEHKEMGLIFASTEIAMGEVASICPVICKVIFGHEYIICTKSAYCKGL